MPSGHPGIRQPELSVLAAADHIGALAQLVSTPAAIIELKRDGGACGRVFRLSRRCVGTVAALGLLAVVVIRGRGRRVSALVIAAVFRLPDTGVSRRHVEVRWDGQVALLSDLNSTNGTTVNNAPVQEWQLADGDVIRVGHSEIIVRVH